jgi:hypothetical protein
MISYNGIFVVIIEFMLTQVTQYFPSSDGIQRPQNNKAYMKFIYTYITINNFIPIHNIVLLHGIWYFLFTCTYFYSTCLWSTANLKIIMKNIGAVMITTLILRITHVEKVNTDIVLQVCMIVPILTFNKFCMEFFFKFLFTVHIFVINHFGLLCVFYDMWSKITIDR